MTANEPAPTAIPHHLATALSCAVPLHIQQLRGLPPDQLADIAHTSATTVATHGDDLQYGGRHCAQAFTALARGLAAAALTAWGGITVAGMHWCHTPACPGPDTPHEPPDSTPRIPPPRPRPTDTVPTPGGVL